mgnify:FL=1
MTLPNLKAVGTCCRSPCFLIEDFVDGRPSSLAEPPHEVVSLHSKPEVIVFLLHAQSENILDRMLDVAGCYNNGLVKHPNVL